MEEVRNIKNFEKYIKNKLDGVTGKYGFYFKDLTTGDSLGLNENELFQAASIIKLPILAVTAKLIDAGELSFDTEILVKDSEKVPSCGAIRFFRGDIKVEVDTLCKTMITISDNTSTNAMMRTIGLGRMNREFISLGMEKSHCERLLFDSSSAAKGKQNRITPYEMGMLLEKIYRHTLVSEEMSRYMEDILLDQQINHKIPGYLPEDIEVGHKTGEDSEVTNDVGIVYTKKPFVICFMFNDADVPQAERAIREISLALASEWNK